MKSPTFDEDMIALAEAALDDKETFSNVAFEIRSEYTCGLFDAAHYTEACLNTLIKRGNTKAQEAMARWRALRGEKPLVPARNSIC